MSKPVWLSLILAVALTLGCTPQQEPEDVPPPPTAPRQEPESATQVIEDYGEGLATSVDKAKGAQARVDIREVQRALQDYALAHEGAYPPSLDDVKDNLSGSVDLTQFNYDPSSGAISINRR